MVAITEHELHQYAELRRQKAAVVKMHNRIENPKHGCCAKPKLCNGHKDECGSHEHGLDRPTWPCATLRALGIKDDTDVRAALRLGGAAE